MYTTILTIHSWLRWVALVAGIAATIGALRGKGDKPGLILMITLDIQMLLGLLLYFVVSPLMAEIRANFGAAMKDPTNRFWAVEHITMMLVAVILVHVGRVLARKGTPESRSMKLFLCFGAATVFMILRTPWPGLAAGRALFRMP